MPLWKKIGVGGFSKILRNFQSGLWQMLTSAYKVGGVKKGQEYAYVIFEWSLRTCKKTVFLELEKK